MTTIHATFQDENRAREAQRKLQFLRIEQIDEGTDGASLTADVGDELVERALHVIRQTGGAAEI
ncbi:hypothetical protein GZH47_06065 [Paenibacillus rhizovicinus]|uniref:Uncharacterized protein n=1 Tax=Paenibacillus rhizovicinus TaxID=2704463 RepID=A0A6C0NW64_9BACL|nr:hypothetical protein [Paenibacillus rhizovicinus]QHW30454.1 hypothetical protein GZH47_06065 [Paenibacillus rhizovicinus]